MPGKVKVKIVAGRNLPIMDRSSDTTDAYVEIKLGNTTFKTDVCRKSLNPQWNSEWYRFEMDDAELQDEPLQIRLMDHDTYSANDAIGKVYLDLKPLLLPPVGSAARPTLTEASNSISGEVQPVVPGNTMSGWFPVYDTMHGIRGEVNVIVKVELFSDFNKFRQSSCGVQFFNSSSIPAGYQATVVHGMVEELIVSDDPEYQWIDRIRTPRASNEARQTLFFKLSGEVQRRIGLKVLESGGNAVIGYLQCFDLEAECGIVVRGLGTAVTLVRIQEPSHALPCHYAEDLDNQTAPSFKNPILSVIPASPLRQTLMEVRHTKGYLAPGSPRNRRSKSPQMKQPFSDYKPKRLGTYYRSFTDNVPSCDNVSLKVLFEQEDMRGETVSSHKKIFERLSSFPKRKFRALRSNSAGNFSRKIPFMRSKSDNVASSLIRSIMDPNSFLDRVPEGEEGESKHSDTDSVIHALRYDDGHLIPISSSSSESSDSDVGDISDVSSMSSTSKEYNKIETDRKKCLKSLAINMDKSTSFDNSITSSKTDDEVFEKDKNHIDVSDDSKQAYTSTVHVVMTPDSSEETHQFSSFVKFKDSPSPPTKAKGTLISLKRQDSFDVTTNNRRKRSDTPPLSEMDPYMKFSFEGKSSYKEVYYGSKPIEKRVFKQPSLDEELKSRPVTNLSFPESVRHLPTVAIGHSSNHGHRTVHTIDVCDRNRSMSSLVDSVEFSVASASLDAPEKLLAICGKSEDDQVDSSLLAESENENTPKTSGELPKTNDTVDKILHNPFKFPSEVPVEKLNLITQLSQHYKGDQNTEKENSIGKTVSIEISSTKSQHDNVDNINLIPAKNDHVINPNSGETLVQSDIITTLSENKSLQSVSFELENNTSKLIQNTINHQSNINELTDRDEKHQSDPSAESKPDVKVELKRETPVCVQTIKLQELQENVTVNFISEISLIVKDQVNNIAEEKICSIKSYERGSDSEVLTPDEDKILKGIKPVIEEEVVKNDKEEEGKQFIDKPDTVILEEPSDVLENSLGNKVTDSRIVNETDQINEEEMISEVNKTNLTQEESKNQSEEASDTVPNPAQLAVVENTNRACDAITSNLNLPLLPLVKSRSATGLVEPCSVPTPRAVAEEAATLKSSQSPVKYNHGHLPAIHRRSSDSDLSITPKGNSLTSSGDRSSIAGGSRNLQPFGNKLAMKKEPLEINEFPYLTVMKFPPGFIIHLGTVVNVRSVKLLERVPNQEEPESRDAWWKEVRLELRNQMKAQACNAVVGYSEITTICDDVCVLSAMGTAALVNVKPAFSVPGCDTPEPPLPSSKLPAPAPPASAPPTTNAIASLDRSDSERTQSTPLKPDSGGGGGGGVGRQGGGGSGGKTRHHSDSMDQPEPSSASGCSLCHLPYNIANVQLPITSIRCHVCGKKKVPDVLLATVEPPEGLTVVGRPCLIHVCVTRPKQHARGENNAAIVSMSLPFMEYDVYKQLINKLRVNGMNACFGIKTQYVLGERLIAVVASGTAMFLEALPAPMMPTITANPSVASRSDSQSSDVLAELQETAKINKEFYRVPVKTGTSQGQSQSQEVAERKEAAESKAREAREAGGSDEEDSDEDLPDLDLHSGNKDVCVFVVDDEKDLEAVNQLIDHHPPEGFFVTATETLTGLDDLEVVRNLQMFTQIWRSRLAPSQPTSSMHNNFQRLLQGIYYKLRRMTPCAVGKMKFRLALPEPDEMQVSIVGMCVGLGEMIKPTKSVRRRAGTLGSASKPGTSKQSDDGDMIFSLEEDQESSDPQSSKTARPKSPARPNRQSTHLPPKERYGVDITPLTYVPGGQIERYLGNLNFFFIRETSYIREGGGMSGFVHSFMAEVLAIIRAHVTALGGNAMVSFFLNECIILNNPHKNHGQCLINVGGDVVSVSYID